jgi:hypothetical protein
MRRVSTFDQLRAAAALGMAELRGAYNERKQKIEQKAEHKRQKAKTAIERQRIKALEIKEMADLEREMYEAKLAAIQAKEKAKKARQATGVFTPGEHLGRFARGAGAAGGAFYKGLTTSSSKRRRR